MRRSRTDTRTWVDHAVTAVAAGEVRGTQRADKRFRWHVVQGGVGGGHRNDERARALLTVAMASPMVSRAMAVLASRLSRTALVVEGSVGARASAQHELATVPDGKWRETLQDQLDEAFGCSDVDLVVYPGTGRADVAVDDAVASALNDPSLLAHLAALDAALAAVGLTTAGCRTNSRVYAPVADGVVAVELPSFPGRRARMPHSPLYATKNLATEAFTLYRLRLKARCLSTNEYASVPLIDLSVDTTGARAPACVRTDVLGVRVLVPNLKRHVERNEQLLDKKFDHVDASKDPQRRAQVRALTAVRNAARAA